MVLGLGGCCGGVAVAASAVSPAVKQSGEAKMMGGEGKQAAERKEKKREHQKAPIVMHQFPFHSRPGLL